MYNYPQYIYPPTTAPVQRFFANPHVQMNSYGFGDYIDKQLGRAKDSLAGVFGANNENSQVGKALAGLNKVGINGDVITAGTGILGKGLYSGISGGLSSGFGKGISNFGTAVGGVFGKINPVLGGAVTLGSNLIGGIANWGWGKKRNTAGIDAFKDATSAMNSLRVADSSNDSIANQLAAQDFGGAFGYGDMGKTGVFNKGAFEDEFNKMMRSRASGQMMALANYDNASTNVNKRMMNNMMLNYQAYGGYFDNPFAHPGSGAIAYGLEQQNLQNQQQMLGQMQAQQAPMQYPQPNGRFFDYGGKMPNSHGGDFTNGLVYIDNGGTHEENPYQGVPMGYDQQGTPNVVEQNEVIIPKRMLGNGGDVSDYVLSDRIPITDEFAEKYHLPLGISIAQAARKLTKESKENPNDIILERTNAKLMQEMRDMQEQIKQQMREQQMQQQLAMQQYANQMGIPAQQAMPVPEEELQLQAMQQAAQEQTPQMQEPMMAFGGNLFGHGGYFGPVNKFEGNPFNPSTIKTNAYNKEYTPADVYRGMGFADAWLSAIEDMKNSGMSDEDIVNTFNTWQEKYENAINNPNDKAAVEDLQRYTDTHFHKVNGVFNADHLFNRYYNPATVSRGADKPHAEGDNPWVDGILEGMTYQRHGGRSDMSDDEVNNIMYRLNGGANPLLPNVEYALPENGMTYRMSIRQPKEGQAFSLSELPEATENDNGEIYKPSSSAKEEPDDDRFESASIRRSPLLPTWQRNLPLWMSGLGVLTDTLGITNRPDYTAANRLEVLADKQRAYMPVSYRPIGQYMRPTLFDPYQLMLENNANTSVAYRAARDNSNGNGAMANAAMLAAHRNAMTANGQFGLQGQQFNMANAERRLGFNRETDAQNSQGIMSADTQNAYNWRYGQGAHASLLGQALGYRMQEKQAADAARALNLSNFVKGMSNYGKENAYINMVNSAPANGGYHYADRRFGIDYTSPFFQIPV